MEEIQRVPSKNPQFEIQNDTERHAWAAWLIFISLCSFLGDTTILTASIKYNVFKFHKLVVTTINHIAVCDLVISLLQIPNITALLCNNWVLGWTFCYLKVYLGYVAYKAGSLLICTMTLGKLLTITYPLRATCWSRKRAHMVCISVWTISFLLMPLAALFTKGNDIYFDYKRYTCDYGFSTSSWTWLKPITYALFGVIPNVTVLVSTVLLLVEAKKGASTAHRTLKWNGIMTVVLTAIFYSFSVLPISLFQIVESLLSDGSVEPGLFSTYFRRLAISFANLNVLANFFIYSLTVPSFRDFVREKLHRLCFWS